MQIQDPVNVFNMIKDLPKFIDLPKLHRSNAVLSLDLMIVPNKGNNFIKNYDPLVRMMFVVIIKPAKMEFVSNLILTVARLAKIIVYCTSVMEIAEIKYNSYKKNLEDIILSFL